MRTVRKHVKHRRNPQLWANDGRHWAVAGTAAALAGIGVWLALPAGTARPTSRPPAAHSPGNTGKLVARRTTEVRLGTTLLASIRRTSPRYSAPGVRASGVVPATWWGVPSVLPVVARRPGWVEVRLPQRPNGSQAWVRAGDVRLSHTRFLIVVNLRTTHLTLFDGRHRVFTAPAGVGTVTDPTPTGRYFVAFSELPPQPNPGYGPFILVTSAHSPNISDWDGSGDAVIGIHGPLGENREIGTTGARISHGCIRLHLSALLKLRKIPAGTPIDIIG